MKQKKIFLIVLLCLFFLPFIVNAEECDITKITITSMEQKGIEGNTEEVEEPTFNDRSINFNLKMFEVGDAITYDMTIKNDSDEDYMIDEETFKTDSEYIVYTLKTNDGDNVVKARSSKNVILSVEYKKEVDNSLLTNNKFDASNSLKLSLNTSEKEGPLDVITTDNIKETKNPLTGNRSIRLIFLILLISLIIISLTYYNKKKYNKYIMLLLFLALIPTVYAICKCDIEVESTIEIEKIPSLFNEIKNLSKEDNTCVIKYEGNVTDKVGQTVTATNVYFDKCADKRNVIFGGFCWQIIRTTETGGTKMIYNGEPVDGKCESDRMEHLGIYETTPITETFDSSYLYGSSYTYDLLSNNFTLKDTQIATLNDSTYDDLYGKYTCKNTTGTCTVLYRIGLYSLANKLLNSKYEIKSVHYSQIGISPLNPQNENLAAVGYMYNKRYRSNLKDINNSDYKYGNSFTYDNNSKIYTLSGEIKQLDNWDNAVDDLKNTHYTCWNSEGTCNKISYIYSIHMFSSNKTARYIELSDGKSIENVLDEMLFKDDVNKYNSELKEVMEKWFENSLENYTDKIEDAVYCNARNISDLGGFNPNGGEPTERNYLKFKNYGASTDLSCQNKTDQFAVENNKAKSVYPVGLMTKEELKNINDSVIIKNDSYFWLMSPYGYDTYTDNAITNYVIYTGYPYYNSSVNTRQGIRPVISLKKGLVFSSGTGSEINPWIIE